MQKAAIYEKGLYITRTAEIAYGKFYGIRNNTQ